MKRYLLHSTLKGIVLTMLSLYFCTALVKAQVTTASINGRVTDDQGPMPGVTVIAVHKPTGTKYATGTREDGRFNFPNVKVGGPYTISTTFVGYRDESVSGINLALGQNYTVNFKLETSSTELEEVVISGKQDKTFNSSRTGASTSISKEQLEDLPSLNRSFQDFTRLTPQSAKGLNFAGRNALFNSLTIDGSVFNNPYGLTELPGGQTNAQPISLDALDQVQVNLAPYDVRLGGFTGAGINAVTKSGTNDISASVYVFRKSDQLTGARVGDVTVPNQEFAFLQSGMRVGGALVPNKLFFFINGELERQKSPGSNYFADRGAPGDGISRVSASDLDLVRSTLLNNFGYDPGAYELYTNEQNNDKFTAKIDWNINDKNKLSVRYNYLKSFRDINTSGSNARGTSPQRGPTATSLPFSNMRYRQFNNINSVVMELNSRFGSKASNNLTVGYTAFRDYRSTFGTPFPVVDIEDGNGANYISLGSEPFSGLNLLNQDIYQFSDNFTYYMGKHTLTFGTANEIYKFSNGFAQFFYGQFRYANMNDFVNAMNGTGGNPLLYQLTYSAIPGNPTPTADLKAVNLSFYAQDEFQIKNNFKLTYGIRVDIPFYPTDLPSNNIVTELTFRDGEKLNTSTLPKTQLLWSPRVGFNWDVREDQSLQVRGGTGIFTGKIPFVWAVNQAGNNGLLFGQDFLNNPTNRPFNPDVTAYIPANPTTPTTFAINVNSPDLKMPQVWRSNLAGDIRLPKDFVLTLEGIYTKDINAVYHRDANLVNPTGKLAGTDNRDQFPGGNANRINSQITNAIVLDNTSEGWSYSLSAQLQRSFKFGLDFMIAYTYSQAKDITSSPGSQAASAYNGNQIVNDPNKPVLSYTSFMLEHKVIGSLSYNFSIFKIAPSTLSLIYDGSAYADQFNNTRISYAYSGNVNRDGSTGSNDLMFIPRDQNDIILIAENASDTRTPEQIWDQLNAFISQDEYLNSRRGMYAERNGGKYPWANRFDLRFTQQIFTEWEAPKSRFEFTLDIINIGNLVNRDWGVTKIINTATPVVFRDFNGPNGQPRFTFPSRLAGTSTFSNNTFTDSRWRMQLGFRYTFN